MIFLMIVLVLIVALANPRATGYLIGLVIVVIVWAIYIAFWGGIVAGAGYLLWEGLM